MMLFDISLPVSLPPVDSISAMMIVWSITRKVIRTVLCCIMYDRKEHVENDIFCVQRDVKP